MFLSEFNKCYVYMFRINSGWGEKGSTWPGLALTARDHRVVGYRVPKEWATLTERERGVGSLAAFRRGSRAGFLAGYGLFVCRGAGCAVCLSRG